jgi:hypothetical protein
MLHDSHPVTRVGVDVASRAIETGANDVAFEVQDQQSNGWSDLEEAEQVAVV